MIIALNGSPNKEGNTSELLNIILKSAKETGAEGKIYHVNEIMLEQKNPFCVVCSNPCNGSCYKNTKLENVFEDLKKAKVLLVGSPVYFGTVSAQLKAFFDKTRKLRVDKNLLDMYGAGVTVGASPFGGQETTIKAIHDIMLVHGMFIIGDGQKDFDCGHHGVCAKRPASLDENAVTRAKILGKRIGELILK